MCETFNQNTQTWAQTQIFILIFQYQISMCDIQSYIRLILFQAPTPVFAYLVLENRLEDRNFNS